MKFTTPSFLALLGSLSICVDITNAKPLPQAPTDLITANVRSPCAYPHTVIRKEWRKLSDREKKAYTNAVVCLAKKPSKAKKTLKGAVSRFDDFQAIHSALTDSIHWVGFFLPWHRYHLALYEQALREECGYKGAQPYWDWTIDTKSGKPMPEWPIFDSKFGLGGNGPFIFLNASQNPFGINDRTGGGCVEDGPFTFPKFTLNIGPSTATNVSNPHCLTRDFAPEIAKKHLVQEVVDEVMAQPDYGHFARRMESIPSFEVGTIHGGGHFGIGGVLGTMGNSYNSPGDPLFYLHHGNLDRIWWQWQSESIWARTTDISGPVLPFDYNNERGANVTLDFLIEMGEVGDGVKIKELMHIKGGLLCYDYE